MKPQDILVLIKIFLKESGSWTIARLAHELYMSSSEVHAGIKRLKAARLVSENIKKAVVPNLNSMEEFFIHGFKYVFPAEIGKEVRGMPTSHSALPLSESIASAEDDALVWPYEFGNVRGKSIVPLYRSVPKAAELDEDFYKILVLLDGIRVGKSREQNLSVEMLSKILREKTKNA